MERLKELTAGWLLKRSGMQRRVSEGGTCDADEVKSVCPSVRLSVRLFISTHIDHTYFADEVKSVRLFVCQHTC